LNKAYIIKVVFAFGTQAAGVGLSFLFNILLARLLGASDTGIYFLCVTVLSICATIARLGLDNAVLRFASVAYNKGQQAALSALYRKSIGLVIVSGILVMLLAWLITPNLPLASGRENGLQDVLSIMLFAIVPTSLVLLQGEYFKAIGKTSTAIFVQAVLLPMLLVLGVLFQQLQVIATIHSIVLLYTLSATLSMLFGVLMWGCTRPGIWLMPGHFDMRLLLRTSMPLLWVAMMNMLMSWTDILVLGVWADASKVGVYGVASRVAGLIAFILMAVNSTIAPRFAALSSADKHDELQRLAQRSAGWTLFASSPVILVMLLFPEFLLRLFGGDFVEGAVVLRILAVGQIINVAVGSVGYLLMMTGQERLMRNNFMASAVLNLIGNLILVPEFGICGAAVSTAFALAFMNIVAFLMVNKKLHINTMGYLFKGFG
jgi:O-antigen/teichoic acid export membrane protein